MTEENKEKKMVWVDDKGIICLHLGDRPSEEDVYKLLDELLKVFRESQQKPKILIYAIPYIGPVVSNMKLRERLIDEAKAILAKNELDKVAVFGGDAVSRTITSFIIRMSGFENMKAFDNEEEARRWLRE
jgi:hypothetical protein